MPPLKKVSGMKTLALDLDVIFSTSVKWIIDCTCPIPHHPFLYDGSKTSLYIVVTRQSSELFVNTVSAIVFLFLVLLRQIISLVILIPEMTKDGKIDRHRIVIHMKNLMTGWTKYKGKVRDYLEIIDFFLLYSKTWSKCNSWSQV